MNILVQWMVNYYAVHNAVFDVVEIEDLEYDKDFIVERNL